MNDSDIIAEINYVTKDILLTLTSIQTKADKEAAQGRGYHPDFTEQEWHKRFPRLPVEKIYYLPGLNLGMVYYDIEKIVYLNLGIYNGQIFSAPTQVDSEYEELILDAIKTEEEYTKQKEYAHVLSGMPDGLRMEAVRQILKLEGPTPYFYDTFMEEYTTAEFSAEILPTDIVDVLLKSKSEEQKKETQQRLDEAFPNMDTIPVFRGMADKSTAPDKAFSWSPDINVAMFFATHLGEYGKVLEGTVSKKDIIEYFCPEHNKGTEHEVFVRPGSVVVNNTTLMYAMDENEIHEAIGTTQHLYRDKAKSLQQLYLNKKASEHDCMHSLRVLFLSLLIGALEECTSEELQRIAEAAIYHDCGRTDDGENDTHGTAAARIYKNRGGKNKMVAFAITAHCMDDDRVQKMIRHKFPESARQTVWRIVSILKDADALDRVRFGFSGASPAPDGLDVNFLRNKSSLRLVGIAQKACLYLEMPHD